jgi:hypothetical protein
MASPSVVDTRFLVISDTHGDENLPEQISRCRFDVAVHCGDLTTESKMAEFQASLRLLESVDASLKLVIAGNHDFTMDIPVFKKKVDDIPEPVNLDLVRQIYGDYGAARQLFDYSRSSRIIFLDEGTHSFRLTNGALLHVYASPYTPSVGDWGFQYHPQHEREWTIPSEVDLVITHGPPHGILDRTSDHKRAGCHALFAAVARARPRLHCFGHIHESWGAKLVTWRNLSQDPSHFTDIDHERSPIIETLATLQPGKFDEPELAEKKLKKAESYAETGYCSVSHCSGSEYPLRPGEQTLFVNAALKDGPRHLPWVIQLPLPLSRAVKPSDDYSRTI